MSLRKYIGRSMLARPGRTLLTMGSIVIGVAATVAFVMTASTTRGAYRKMFSTITGRADLEVSIPGDGAFAATALPLVVETPHVAAAAPVLRRTSTLYANKQRVTLEVLGIDSKVDRQVRDYEIPSGRMPEKLADIVLDAEVARRLGLQLNDPVKLLSNRGLQNFEICGLLAPKGGTAVRQAGIALVSLPRAQAIFRSRDKLNLIQIVVDGEDRIEPTRRAIAAKLPAGLEVRPPNRQSQLMEETLKSSEQGLRLSTIFSLLLSGFIILNTFLMNVSERRRQLSILRAIGATSGQIRRSLLGESLVLGVAGVLLGIGLGATIGRLLNRSLSSALDLQLPPAEVSAWTIAAAAVFGLATSLIGAYIPAVRAGRVSPLEGMDRVSAADVSGVSRSYIAVGFLLVLASSGVIAVALFGLIPIIVPTFAAPFLLIGIVMISPLVMEPLVQLGAAIIRPVLRLEGRLAVMQLLRHRTRTTLTAGVLFVAGATGIGISYSILDNVDDVRDWYKQALIGDFFVRAMRPDMATGAAADLPEELGEDLKRLPHIVSIESATMVETSIGETKVIVVARDFIDPEPPALDLTAGDRHTIRDKLFKGDVVVASVLATRLKLAMGDEIELATSHGPKRFRICGIANDYMMGGYSIYMHRPLAVQMLDVQGVDAYAIRAVPGEREKVRAALLPLCDRHGVLLHSLTEVVENIEFTIRGIVWCLWGLIGLGFLIGAFGVVNTLTMNVLEQTRELGLLRIVAMTRKQVRRTILTQALLIGMVGLVPGIVGGLITAYVINLATMPSIGHPVEFGFRPGLLAGAFAGALAITLAAAWFPARRAARLDLVRALHYE
jgi:putative ABC transport system permease protein